MTRALGEWVKHERLSSDLPNCKQMTITTECEGYECTRGKNHSLGCGANHSCLRSILLLNSCCTAQFTVSVKRKHVCFGMHTKLVELVVVHYCNALMAVTDLNCWCVTAQDQTSPAGATTFRGPRRFCVFLKDVILSNMALDRIVSVGVNLDQQ